MDLEWDWNWRRWGLSFERHRDSAFPLNHIAVLFLGPLYASWTVTYARMGVIVVMAGEYSSDSYIEGVYASKEAAKKSILSSPYIIGHEEKSGGLWVEYREAIPHMAAHRQLYQFLAYEVKG